MYWLNKIHVYHFYINFKCLYTTLCHSWLISQLKLTTSASLQLQKLILLPGCDGCRLDPWVSVQGTVTLRTCSRHLLAHSPDTARHYSSWVTTVSEWNWCLKESMEVCFHPPYIFWYEMIYLLTAIGLTPGGNSTVHIYTQYIEQHNNLGKCGPCPV